MRPVSKLSHYAKFMLLFCAMSYAFESGTKASRDIALAQFCKPTIHEQITTNGIYVSSNPLHNLKIDNNGLNDDFKGTIYELPQERADKKELFRIGRFSMGEYDMIPKIWVYDIRLPQGLLQVSTNYVDFAWDNINNRTIIGLINNLPNFPRDKSSGKYYRLSYGTNFGKLAKNDVYGNCKEKLNRLKNNQSIDYDGSKYCLSVVEISKSNLSRFEIIVLLFKPFYIKLDDYENVYKNTNELPYISLQNDFMLDKEIALDILTRVYVKIYDKNHNMKEIKLLATYPSVYNIKTNEKCSKDISLDEIINSTNKE